MYVYEEISPKYGKSRIILANLPSRSQCLDD